MQDFFFNYKFMARSLVLGFGQDANLQGKASEGCDRTMNPRIGF